MHFFSFYSHPIEVKIFTGFIKYLLNNFECLFYKVIHTDKLSSFSQIYAIPKWLPDTQFWFSWDNTTMHCLCSAMLFIFIGIYSDVTRGDWGGHVHPSFPRGRLSNFSKCVEKLGGGLIFIHLEHLVAQLWLLTLYFTVSIFVLAKCPPLQKMMLEKTAFPTFWNR